MDSSDVQLLPFKGSLQRYQTTLSDRQIRMIEKLEDTCEQILGVNYMPQAKDVSSNRGYKPYKAKSRSQSLDRCLKEKLIRNQNSTENEAMHKFRASLPVAKEKKKIMEYVEENQVFVLSGETGCGKTTQITQFILDHAIQKESGSEVSIVCTQPRRVAAISVAERVAMERGEKVGSSVGYQVKMLSALPSFQGSILYCTGGILLQRLQSDRRLSQFSHIIIDEVHERDIMTDIILVLLKEVIVTRPDVKVIIMSATLNGEQFSKFFHHCPVLHVPGFMHPVQPFYIKEILEMIEFECKSETGDQDESYQQLSLTIQSLRDGHNIGDLDAVALENLQINMIASLIAKIHSGNEAGAILVFLPGWEDICRLENLLGTYCLSGILVVKLHGSMSQDNQRFIFNPAPSGTRKVVIATNIAESSVTIDDIVFVIDSGRAKMKMFDVTRNYATLKSEWISKANCKQRMGRAGRLRPGKVYKIYSRKTEADLLEYMCPEMLRTRLENVLLRIKILDYADVDSFLGQLMDVPNRKAVQLALETLLDIGALDGQGELTSLGRILANLAIDPQLGKMMILGCIFSCVDPILTIVAALEYKSPFYLTSNRESVKAIDRLSNETQSDHMTVANAFAAWCSSRMNRLTKGKEEHAMYFCRDNCLSQGVLHTMEKLKAQCMLELHKAHLLPSRDVMDPKCNANSGVEAVVRAVISMALAPNIAQIQKNGDKYYLAGWEQCLEFHPKSVNRGVLAQMESTMRAEYVPRLYTYFEKMHTSSTFLNDTTAASPMCLLLLASNVKMVTIEDPLQDADIDLQTKLKLNIDANTKPGEITDIRLTSGNNSLRLLVCKSSDANKIQVIRRALDHIIQEQISGRNSGPTDPHSANGKVLSLLFRVLNADSTS